MLNKLQIRTIAIACYNANKAYCESIGDNSFSSWEEAPQWQRDSIIDGIKFHLKNPKATKEDSHKNWLKLKEQEGWKYGAVKNPETKEHPCFVPYNQLPESQKFKDALFMNTFNACKAMLETAFTPKEDFEVVEEGTYYKLPMYEVVDGIGIVRRPDDEFVGIPFVRGSKVGAENVEKRIGTLHEHLLAMMIHDLEYKNKLVPSREAALTITRLQEALHWQRQRQIDRTARNVVGTYQK